MVLLLLACASEKGQDSEGGPSFHYPMDDVLTFADLQALGTHNSYHIQTEGSTQPEWEYTHPSLDVQLGEQGVRQFELDIWYDPAGFSVFHIPVIDAETNCSTFVDCLTTMKSWSDANPAHHPLLTLLEVEDAYDTALEDAYFSQLEAELLSVWPRERLLTPDDVQRDAPSLSEGIAQYGWPTLGDSRGKALFVLHTGSDWRGAYTDGDTTTEGRALFPDAGGDMSLAVAAVHTMNDPNDANIATVVAAGHLVRTRADGDCDEARNEDTTQRDAALASGAHFVSTDFPEPTLSSYFVAIPDGTPSRCNPLRPVDGCTSTAIEDPSFLQ